MSRCYAPPSVRTRSPLTGFWSLALCLVGALLAGCAGEQSAKRAAETEASAGARETAAARADSAIASTAARAESGPYRDDLGRPVPVPDSVGRVVTLAPNLTDLTYVAGGGDRLVGVTGADDHPRLDTAVERISALPVDFEQVAALRPDLVLATDQVNDPKAAETFEALEIPIAFLSFDEVRDVPRAVREIGRLIGTRSHASEAADSLLARIEAIERRSPREENRPDVLFLIGDDPLYGFGRGSYVHDMIELAGGRSVTDTLENASPVLSEEYVLRASPDLIIGTFGENYNAAELRRKHPTWDHLGAVRDGRVYSIPENWVLRPGPRIVRGIERMAELIRAHS